ncbi:MAG: ATP-grasp domain-containing protein [Candidatus Cloacimonetes bacterium]|nr:ATP-grasp domain-containing protein [Candidatus Cloacimonadota bacterium]
MRQPITTCLIATGGPGHEAPVSLVSANFAFKNMPDWVRPLFLVFNQSEEVCLFEDFSFCTVEGNLARLNSDLKFYPLYRLPDLLPDFSVDISSRIVVFQAIHGHLGEDGKIVERMKAFGWPVTGFDSQSSIMCFDKVLTKLALSSKGIPVVPYTWHLAHETGIKKPFEGTVFLKPAREGSSVGVVRVTESDDFNQAVSEVFTYDSKIVIEPEILGRELEVSVLKVDSDWQASPVGEISKNTWYSFSEKYLSDTKTTTGLASGLSLETKNRIRSLAIEVVKVLEGSGFARVDFFLSHQGELFVNEVNTIPGMTNISMFPWLWEQAGVSGPQLIEKILREYTG